MYLITYYTENPLLDNGGAYGQCVAQSPVVLLEEIEAMRSKHAEVFIINVLPVTEDEAERLGELDAVD